ncbi:hypothetical protein MKX08_007159 [Trichoderma sp. CBMAI-0020]|nr:hypothetical protein MKX08_007159 [Trichoderma sp. CBMAI-0020]
MPVRPLIVSRIVPKSSAGPYGERDARLDGGSPYLDGRSFNQHGEEGNDFTGLHEGGKERPTATGSLAKVVEFSNPSRHEWLSTAVRF